MRVTICLFESVSLAATSVRMENPQSIGYGKGSFSGILSTGKGKRVRPALALAVDVDSADLIDQRIYQSCNLVRITSENTDLLTVAGIDHVLNGLTDFYQRAARG